jgi:hypothetical protein
LVLKILKASSVWQQLEEAFTISKPYEDRLLPSGSSCIRQIFFIFLFLYFFYSFAQF